MRRIKLAAVLLVAIGLCLGMVPILREQYYIHQLRSLDASRVKAAAASVRRARSTNAIKALCYALETQVRATTLSGSNWQSLYEDHHRVGSSVRADPPPAVVEEIVSALVTIGLPALPTLKDLKDRSEDPVVRAISVRILRCIQSEPTVVWDLETSASSATVR